MRVWHALLIPLLFCLSGCIEDAFARPPVNLNEPAQYTRVGGTHWSRQWTVPTSAGTAGLVLNTPGDNSYAAGDPHLFEWSTSARVSCQAAAVFHWVLDTSVTVATNGLVTDAAPMTGFPSTGAGDAFRVEAGTYVDEVILKTMFDPNELKLGARTGFCTGTTAGAQNGWPCDADADCPGGACRGENRGDCTESGVNYCCGSLSTTACQGDTPWNHVRGGFLQSLGGTAADCWVSEVR